MNKNKIKLNLDDEINVELSNREFISNYQFNIMLIYILSLEIIIKLISDVLNKHLRTELHQNKYFYKL